jgi:hypothetical protein
MIWLMEDWFFIGIINSDIGGGNSEDFYFINSEDITDLSEEEILLELWEWEKGKYNFMDGEVIDNDVRESIIWKLFQKKWYSIDSIYKIIENTMKIYFLIILK